MRKEAKANIVPVRQANQYNCMATSMMMCLRANGVSKRESTIELVNKVMGCAPMQGASWEDAIACAQHFGMVAQLICPATIRVLKSFTDRGIPLIIAWNPEGRDWSHASVVFDVDDDLTVHIADPNIPDPDETVRVMPKSEFYSKWAEKWPNYIVRRPAMAISREIDSEGRQMLAAAPKGPEVIENAGRTYVNHAFIQELTKKWPYPMKVPLGWLIYTGLTGKDEVWFIEHQPLEKGGPMLWEVTVNPARPGSFDLIRNFLEV